MKAEEITIRVTPDAAQVYRSASEELRRKLDLLLSLRLSQFRDSDRQSLTDLMREISREAQSRGMTPAILKSILDER